MIAFEETPKDFKRKIKNFENSGKLQAKNSWVINAFGSNPKREKIVNDNDEFMTLIDWNWKNFSDITKLHLLSFVKDLSIRCIRDLNENHINFLLDIKNTVLNLIEERYSLTRDNIRVFFHYLPSTWILHIHFTHMNVRPEINEILFDEVIDNLSRDSNYYKNAIMTVHTSKEDINRNYSKRSF